jgi:hypothetical protein
MFGHESFMYEPCYRHKSADREQEGQRESNTESCSNAICQGFLVRALRRHRGDPAGVNANKAASLFDKRMAVRRAEPLLNV